MSIFAPLRHSVEAIEDEFASVETLLLGFIAQLRTALPGPASAATLDHAQAEVSGLVSSAFTNTETGKKREQKKEE